MTIKMIAPTGLTGVVQASKSGTTYTIPADGRVDAQTADVADLERAGFTIVARDGNAANGLGTVQINLMRLRNSDGSVLAAAAAAGKFGMSITAGTASGLVTEVANNNTKTDILYDEIVLPASYVAGQDITLTVNAKVTIGSGTLSVRTLAAAAYKIANDGTQGSTLIATAAQNMANAGGDLAFVITGTTLSPGDRLALKLTTVLTETAASAVSATINSARLS